MSLVIKQELQALLDNVDGEKLNQLTISITLPNVRSNIIKELLSSCQRDKSLGEKLMTERGFKHCSTTEQKTILTKGWITVTVYQCNDMSVHYLSGSLKSFSTFYDNNTHNNYKDNMDKVLADVDYLEQREKVHNDNTVD